MKLRMVWLRGIDVVYLAVAWSIVWGGGMLVAFYAAKEPLLPFVNVWAGGITFAAMTWICEFGLPYLHRKWQERTARHREKRPGGAVDSLISCLEAYNRCETDFAAIDKLFKEVRAARKSEKEKG